MTRHAAAFAPFATAMLMTMLGAAAAFWVPPSQPRTSGASTRSALFAENPESWSKGAISAPCRRDFLLGGAAAAALPVASQLAFVSPASAAPPPTYASSSAPPPMMGRGGVTGPRIEGIGDGFDVASPPPSSVPSSSDVIYPASMLGTWRVTRIRTDTEGDLGMAGVAWRLMGGGDDATFARELSETYDARYVEAPESTANAAYDFEGRTLRGAVLDRGNELSARKGSRYASDVTWDTARPDVLRYMGGFGEPVELAVVQRRVEPPSDEGPGFGSDELIRITASPGGLLGAAAGPVVRAARVKRRFRRAFDEEGNRIVEGLEIVKTYRVMDGVAGVEMPTSTTKSRIRMTRLQ